MLRRISFLMALVVMASALWFMPAQAAGAPWQAWLYDQSSGRMTQVDDTGATLHDIVLPADAGSVYSRNVAISADGLLLGYTAATTIGTTLNIYNLVTNAIYYNLMLPPDITTSLEFSGSSLNFSNGNSTFAFSYTKYESHWQILIIDLSTFTSTILNEGDPVVASIGSSSFGFLLPVISYNRNQDIKFLMIPLGTDGARSYDAYTWNTSANTFTPNDAYITPDTDTFALTNEVVLALSDTRFPNSDDPLSGYPTTNTLQVFDPLSNERYVVSTEPYNNTPRFIQGGERVAVINYDSVPDSVQTQTLKIIERSGVLSGTVNDAPSTDITAMLGTLNGFIFSAGGSMEAAGIALFYVETRLASTSYTAVRVWNNPSGGFARVVWVSDGTAAAVSTFPVWGRAAAPTGAGSSALVVGGQAQVQTTAGDVLNLRSGPARSFARLGTVNNGTVVTILEGPNSSDGLTWWRIRLPTGGEGWVVDAADGVQTLIPR